MIEPTGRRRVIDDGACSTAQAAEALGVSRRRVQTLIKQRRLDGEAEKWGRDWQIDAESVENRRKGMEQKKREP